MAKGRMLQNRISKSNKIASLSSDTVRLLYTWMLSHLDVNGNFYADPVMVNNLIFTRLGHSTKVVSLALDELVEKGLIVRYQVDGEVYLNYPDFLDKQPKLNPDREGTPDIPNITPESLITNSGVNQELLLREKTQYKIREDKIREDNSQSHSFEIFWKAYPRKVNKKEALSSWKKARLPAIDFILSAIDRHKKSDQWIHDNGKYIPHPSTWLNQERWNDEIIPGGLNAGTNSNRGNGNQKVLSEQDRLADEINAEYYRRKAAEAADNPTGNTG